MYSLSRLWAWDDDIVLLLGGAITPTPIFRKTPKSRTLGIDFESRLAGVGQESRIPLIEHEPRLVRIK